MDEPFKIEFDFNLDSSAKVLHLQGEVFLHHSTPHYKISRINRFGHSGGIDLLPDIDIKCVLIDRQPRWVHTDSGKESNLSTTAGKAIESVQPAIEIAEQNSCEEDKDGEES